jgi:hypothetical protein
VSQTLTQAVLTFSLLQYPAAFLTRTIDAAEGTRFLSVIS